MPSSTLASFFAFAGAQTSASNSATAVPGTPGTASQNNPEQAFLKWIFDNVIKDCQSSRDCHVVLLEFTVLLLAPTLTDAHEHGKTNLSKLASSQRCVMTLVRHRFSAKARVAR